MKRELPSEEQLGAIVVAWLERLGGDVYQEVEVHGGVADIVARVRAELWIVEVKQTLRLSLITQALERRRLAHRVYVATPSSKYARDVVPLCEEVGIGVLEVSPGSEGVSIDSYDFSAPAVRVLADGRRWNSRPVELAKALRPEHKTHAKAGAIGAGGRWTPFRHTCDQLARLVNDEPGIALKDAITKITHHYRTARSARVALSSWIPEGKVPGVRLENAKLFPVEVPR